MGWCGGRERAGVRGGRGPGCVAGEGRGAWRERAGVRGGGVSEARGFGVQGLLSV